MTNEQTEPDVPTAKLVRTRTVNNADGQWIEDTFDTGAVVKQLRVPSPAWLKRRDGGAS